MVTTIDVVEIGDVEAGKGYGDGAKYVEFDGKIKANPNDDSIAFLLKVREKEVEKDPKDDSIRFQAIKVPLETFRERIIAEEKKLLVCVHGFQAEPESWLDTCAQIQTSADFDHIVVPVIWPSVGAAGIDISIKYDREQAIAYQAGKALAPIAELGMESKLSLMCHSMGNRVLLSYVQNNSSVDKKFDDVFMVSADVWEEVFNDRVINDTWFQPPWNYWNLWEGTGLKLCNMLKDNGKIHVVNYPGDVALIGSEYWENWRRRLGRFGKNGQGDRIHKDCVDKIVAYEATQFEDEVKEEDPTAMHSYQAAPTLIKYYNEVLNAN